MARKLLSDAAASKLARQQEEGVETPRVLPRRKAEKLPKSFRLGAVDNERLRRLSERLGEEARAADFRDGGHQGLAAAWRENRRQKIAGIGERRGFREQMSTTFVVHRSMRM